MIEFRVYNGRFFDIEESLLEKCYRRILVRWDEDEYHLFSEEKFTEITECCESDESSQLFLLELMTNAKTVEDKSDLFRCLNCEKEKKTLTFCADFESNPIIIKLKK